MVQTEYDVVIVGGGPGGLQAAIHLSRNHWRVLVVDRGKGRAFYTPSYHNLLGYPNGVSGSELLRKGKDQAKKFGAEFLMKIVTDLRKDDDGLFTVTAQRRKEHREQSSEQIDVFRTRKIVLNTGIMDRHPDVPNVYHWAGFSIYYCPDCDGYEMTDKRVVVVGRGNAGPSSAQTLLMWTSNLAVVNVDPAQPISAHWREAMAAANISIYESPLKEFVGEDRYTIEQVVLQDGTVIPSEKVFSALGMYSIHSELGKKLGVETLEAGYIIVDPRTKQTSVDGVWAVGDVVAHSQQIMIAMGEGAQAAIWINKSLRGGGRLPDRRSARSS